MFKGMVHKIAILSVLLLASAPIQAVNALNINNPLSTDSPQEFIGLIIKAILGLTGSIALIYFIAGGFMWMTAGGNMDKVKHGKDTLIWATLGLLIVFSAYSILNFVFEIIPTN